jgi:hypothetical protein
MTKLEFIGGQEGPVTFTVNGRQHRASKMLEFQFIEVPDEDVDALLKTGYFSEVKVAKVAAPKKVAPKKKATKKVSKK